MSDAEDAKNIANTTASERLGIVVAKDNDVAIGETNIRLNLIEGFEELADRQQRYLQVFAEDPFNKTLAGMQLGYDTTEVNRWFSQDNFSKIANIVRDIYTEALKGIDFKEAIHNSKIRGRVIKAQENDGKYNEKKEGNKSVHFHGTSVSDLQKMFGK